VGRQEEGLPALPFFTSLWGAARRAEFAHTGPMGTRPGPPQYDAPVPGAPIIPAALSRRWWAMVVAVAMLVAALLARVALTRDIRLDAEFTDVPVAWALEWSGPDGRRNGHWIDLGELTGRSRVPRTSTKGSIELRRRLASGTLDAVRLSWQGGAGGKVVISGPMVIPRALGRDLPGEAPVLLGVEGGEVAPRDGAWVLTCREPQGRVVMSVPPVPLSAYLSLVLVALPIATGLMLLPGVLWRLGQGAERLLGECTPRPAPRWALGGMLAVVVGVPVWLAVRTPLVVTGDGTAYIWLAHLVIENGNFEHLDGWRLPGYAMVLLPFMAGMERFAERIAWAQAAMSVATSLLLYDMLKRRVPGVWAAVGVALAALDLPVQVWQSVFLSEHVAALLTVLSVWMFIRVGDRVGGGRGAAGHAVLLGLVLAAMCCTRANLQVFAALMPLALLGVGVLRGRRRGGVLAAGACMVTVAACLLPIFVHNHRTFGRASLVVGSQWSRFIWMWDYGVFDWNQSEAITFTQFRDLRDRCEAGEVGSWGVTDLLQEWNAPPVPSHANRWTQRDERCRVMWRESFLRRPEFVTGLTIRGAAGNLGMLGVLSPHSAGEVRQMLAVVRGWERGVGGTNWTDDLNRFPDSIRGVLARTVSPWPTLSTGDRAVFNALYWAFTMLHHAILPVLVVGMARLWVRREWVLLFACLVLVGHAVAIPLATFSTNPRYTMPLMALTGVLAVVGASGPRRDPRGDGP
jgi:hypothetical protein